MDIATKLTDLTNDLRNCRRNIIVKGGQISDTAGFSEVAEKILEIPLGTSGTESVRTVIDDSISVFKQVPLNSTRFCYLSKLGGYTHEVPDDSTILAPIRIENAKPSAIRVHGANLLNLEDALKYWNAPIVEVNGDSYTFSGIGDSFEKPFVFTNNADICTISITSGFVDGINARIDLGFYDGKTFVSNKNFDLSTYTTLTSTAKVNAIRLNYGGTPAIGCRFGFSELRINYGIVDCGFTPYHESITYTLPESITSLPNLGLGLYDNEYNEVDLVNGKYIQRCNTKTFVGTENFTKGTVITRSRFVIAAPLDCRYWRGASGSLSKQKCDYFESDASIDTLNGNDTVKNKVSQWSSNWYWYVDGTQFPDLETWKAYLAEHPMELVYELEMEKTEDLNIGDFNPLIEVEGGGFIEFITDSGYAPNSTVVFQTIL